MRSRRLQTLFAHDPPNDRIIPSWSHCPSGEVIYGGQAGDKDDGVASLCGVTPSLPDELPVPPPKRGLIPRFETDIRAIPLLSIWT